MLLLIAALAASAATISPARPRIPGHEHPVVSYRGARHTPGIRVWTSGDDLFHRGDRVQLYYRTERDAYVTIFRVDTDGRVQVLFPRQPDDENYGYGGATYSVSNYDRSSAFYVDDYNGVGYIYAVASSAPFDYSAVEVDGRWDLRSVSDGRIHGDPLTSMEEVSAQLMPQEFEDYDTHLLPYYVEQRYDYPRFVCYDCHTYTPWAYWDPYLAWCRRYTMVVYNDPYYYYPSYWYPNRYYGGRRVVYTQQNTGRYVFKTRENSAPGIDYRDRRLTQNTPTDRRSDTRGVRGIDLGGTGSVPAPRTPNRRLAQEPTGGGGGADQPRPRDLVDERDPPVVGAGDPSRRRGASDGTAGQPSGQGSDAGRRPADRQPGIEIVPNRPSAEGRRPTAPENSGSDRPSREDTPRADDQRRPAGREDANRPSSSTPAERAGYGNEPRPSRPGYTPGTEPVRTERRPVEQDTRTNVRPDESRRDASPEQIREAPRAERPTEERRPDSRPQASQPREAPPQREAAPPRQSSPPPRESSPPREARPQSSPPRESPRPQSSPESRNGGGSNPGLVRRRP
jgi:hypothetical protein